MNSVYKKILSYNAKRNKNFVHLKYKAISENPHRFFRGTNHLFNEYLVKESIVKNIPFTWTCSDLHLENFGSYKAGNGLIYFDINDFDEACIGPCTVDLVKLCTSVLLVSEDLKFSEEDADKICNSFLKSYKEAILTGHASRIEEPIATGLIKTFFEKVEKRNRKIFLKDRLTKQNKEVRIKTDFRRYYPLANSEKKVIKKSLNDWVKENNRDKDFFTFIDAAFRIAGTGSLGLNRYCVLVKGKGKPDYCLLDIKQPEKTSLEKIYATKQVKFNNPAQMVVQAQRRMNDTAPAGFTTIAVKKECYVFKEHQPHEDDFTLLDFKNEKTDFIKLLKELGELVAWAQLRSSGLDGTANGDELIKFAKTNKIEKVIPCAKKMYKQVLDDYKSYMKDYTSKKA
ncbi:MAG: DUF2252 family protein [Bacteroidia bacterium]